MLSCQMRGQLLGSVVFLVLVPGVVVLGLISGYLLVLSLRDEGITVFTVPVLSTIVILFVSFIVGVIAAVIPARRATKVDIIEAIATT